ncbi:zinc finger, C2H2 type [Cooperia oncophora]
MHHSLYSYNEANNNTVNNHGIESIYATLTANQLPLRDALPATPCGAVSAPVDPAMAMGNRSSVDVAALVDRAMSIDEHLQSMPMPLTGWNDHQFRSQDELDMLSMGSAGRSVLQGPQLPCQLRNVIVPRCDGGVASSSDASSSSSCSPSSTENLHHQQHRQHQQLLKGNDASVDSNVASIPNHSVKHEPSDADFPVDGPNGSTHRLPMQPMSLHLAAGYGGRCSNDSGASEAMTTTSSSSTPTPVRRSRSNHDGMLKCQFCPKKWADQTALHTHMADCRMMRGHECAQCGKRFKARGGLQQHLRIHSNDRPYACHFCAKRFTQKSHVDQHERIHTGAKPFSCQYCGRAFRQRSQQLGRAKPTVIMR